VLAILGPSNNRIPVPVAPSLLIALFRANAVQKTGNLQAVAELSKGPHTSSEAKCHGLFGRHRS
jgi:hypothetical protein